MNDATLAAFRQIAADMGYLPGKTDACDWQWIGPHMSQRMFGITEKRAKDYATKYGGEARKMQYGK